MWTNNTYMRHPTMPPLVQIMVCRQFDAIPLFKSILAYCWINRWEIFNAFWIKQLLWRHNEHDSVANHQPRGCIRDRLFSRRSKKTSKLRVTGLCVGNSRTKGQFRGKCFHLMTSSWYYNLRWIKMSYEIRRPFCLDFNVLIIDALSSCSRRSSRLASRPRA